MLGLILFLSFFQMMHISFYGMPVYPSAIYLLFTQMHEVTGTLFNELQLFIRPSLIVVTGLIIIYFTNKIFPPKQTNPVIGIFFILYLIYNPVRTYLTGNTWGRQPSTQELMGVNIYLSSSYFLGKILPYKLSSKNQIDKKDSVTYEKIDSFKGNIIFVIGESLSSNHLSLFDYPLNTTPYLKSLKDDANFFAHRAISSGVSTDIAVGFLMNNTFGLSGQNDIILGNHCLFKLAKKSGFETTFYSSQSQEQLRYITNSICPKSIDHYQNIKDLDPDILNVNAADDDHLLKYIDEDLKTSQHFYILHQRGSHSPYHLRYKEENKFFDSTGVYKKDRLNHYNNSVVEFDQFMKKLIDKIKLSPIPTIMIYVSDHGEALGVDGIWGHAALKKPSIEIPLLIYKHKTDLELNFSKVPTHLEVSLFISKLLGHKSNIEFPLKNYQILGNDMDGFAGYLDLKFNEEGEIESMKRMDL